MAARKKPRKPWQIEGCEVVTISKLHYDPSNVRQHPERNLRAIKASLVKFGQQRPILLGPNNVVVAGNGTLEAAREIPWPSISVVRTELEGPEAVAYAIADNRTSELAEWDLPNLTLQLDSLEELGYELPEFGIDFTTEELAESVLSPSDEPNGPEVPEDLPEPASVPQRCVAGNVWALGSHRLYVGDVREQLARLSDESVQCVVTSPPYWGLRDYGTAEWEGGDAACDHQRTTARSDGGRENVDGFHGSSRDDSNKGVVYFSSICEKCGAKRIDSQVGLEPTPDMYLETMVEIFRDVRRVLRKDGTCWINMGDCYASGGDRKHGGFNPADPEHINESRLKGESLGAPMDLKRSGLKVKDLVGQPWRLALALQADGWWLRSDIIWAKPNPMPESCTDRPTKSHEHVFLLAKSAKYSYDADAVRLPNVSGEKEWNMPNRQKNGVASDRTYDCDGIKGANLRDVWTIPTKPYAEAHFATFPPKLIEPCIKAGTSIKGCCADCGAPWVRVVEAIGGTIGRSFHSHENDEVKGNRTEDRAWSDGTYQRSTIGWQPSCNCEADTVPCVVLDPFMGSGTTMIVCEQLGRGSMGIELNPKYADLTLARWEMLTGKTAELQDA